MATTTRKPTTRTQARKVYIYTLENWAVYATDIAEGIGMDVKQVNQLLRQLERRGLVGFTHVNGERTRTWQSNHDVENDDQAAKAGREEFDASWPKSDKGTSNGGPKNPATGPRYTQAQLTKAMRLRKQGKGRKDVAAAVGIKSPNYLARMLTRMEAEQAKAAKPARKGKGRKPTTKAAA